MRSLGVGIVWKWFALPNRASEDNRVLPPFLRRPVRILSRTKWRTPTYFGMKGLVVFFAATVASGIILGGHTQTVISAVTAETGLAIDKVKITGQSETSEVDILDRLDLGGRPSLFTFDVDAARARIETLPWVARATLKKLYPDTLEVTVAERLPYALWQHGESVSLIDPQGTVITDYVGERYKNLPRVVGPGANSRVDEFLDLILSQPALLPRVEAGVLVSERRWNIITAEAVEIMLPEVNPFEAYARVAALDADHRLLSRELVAVDLRSPDRTVLRLTERGLAERRMLVGERQMIERKRRTNT